MRRDQGSVFIELSGSSGRRDGIVGIEPKEGWERELLEELDEMCMKAGLVAGGHWPDLKHAVKKLIGER